jgi:hypothetical protein
MQVRYLVIRFNRFVVELIAGCLRSIFLGKLARSFRIHLSVGSLNFVV